LDKELLKILNVPMRDITVSGPDCPVIVEHYHEFLASTTKLLQAVDEKQQIYRWDGESTVFNALGWLQSLWASRTAVSPFVVLSCCLGRWIAFILSFEYSQFSLLSSFGEDIEVLLLTQTQM
jgi:hypothetical protein